MSLNKASEWWRKESYTKRIRFRKILGIPIPYKESAYSNYFQNRKDISKNVIRVADYVREKTGFVSLNENSRIMEPGCNVGSHLFFFQNKYACEIFGFDISQGAITTAEQKVFRNTIKGHFWVDDFYREDLFTSYPENYFDLIYTVGFLMHLPINQEKRKQIDQMVRVSRLMIIFEYTKPEKIGQTELFQDGEYALAYDDYASYGFTALEDPFFIKKNWAVFYKK